MAGTTGLEPVTTGSTIRHSDQLSYDPMLDRGGRRDVRSSSSPPLAPSAGLPRQASNLQTFRLTAGRSAYLSYTGMRCHALPSLTGPGGGCPSWRGRDSNPRGRAHEARLEPNSSPPRVAYRWRELNPRRPD
jgi:hypothetical protein